MAICDTCGNNYDKTFTITRAGQTGTFDSFECAIHLMAPTCAHCGCRILGHGVEASGGIYCCAHCARETGHTELVDRAADDMGHNVDDDSRSDEERRTTADRKAPQTVLKPSDPDELANSEPHPDTETDEDPSPQQGPGAAG